METISDFVVRTSGSFSTAIARKSDVSLPMHTDAKPRPKFQVKALLGHCLYRRVVIWTTIVFALLTVVIFDPRLTTQSRNVLHYVHGSKSLVKEAPNTAENILLQNQGSVAVNAHQQEVIHEVKLGVKVEVLEDATNDVTTITLNDVPNNTGEDTLDDIPNDKPDNSLNDSHDGAPQDAPKVAPDDILNEIPKDELARQEEDTSQNEEDANGPKWLRYKQ